MIIRSRRGSLIRLSSPARSTSCAVFPSHLRAKTPESSLRAIPKNGRNSCRPATTNAVWRCRRRLRSTAERDRQPQVTQQCVRLQTSTILLYGATGLYTEKPLARRRGESSRRPARDNPRGRGCLTVRTKTGTRQTIPVARALARRFAIAFGDLPSASLRRISFLFAVLDIPTPQLTGCR